MKLSKRFKLIISILCPGAVGFLSSVATMSSMSTWYQTLSKPIFTPPDWLFAPVWTGLYVLMGFAFYEIWINKKKDKKMAISLFIIQLILNGLWSIIFFGLKMPLFAFIELIILLGLIITTTYYFRKIFKPAAWLMYPYILWVVFAGALNLGIVILN